jgi:hypothetical protein
MRSKRGNGILGLIFQGSHRRQAGPILSSPRIALPETILR